MDQWIVLDFELDFLHPLKSSTLFLLTQGLSVLEQGKIDQFMLDLDGTDNKCMLL